MHPAEVVLGNGELGVSFFFVISGFLITYLLLKELRATRTISFYNFYVRRVTRIFPAFYVYLVFVSSLSILGFLKLTATDVIMSACFVWNYLPLGTGSWWVAQTWSLSIEEQFYVIWPIALATLGPRTATRAAVLVILLEPAIRVATYLLFPSYRARIPVMLHTRADILMFGCLLALMQDNQIFRAAMNHLCRSRYLTAVVGFLFVVDPLLSDRLHGIYGLPVGFTLQGASIALIVYALLKPHDCWLWRLFNVRPVNWIGVRSYGLYLWQQLFLTKLNTTVTGLFPINIAAALVASAISYRWIELPVMRMRPRLQRLRISETEAISEPKVTSGR